MRGKAFSKKDLPFEIFEIGAVKLDPEFQLADQFHRLIRPRAYRQIHPAIADVTHVNMKELRQNGESFEVVARAFLKWCGPDALYFTWGPMDLTELQRNMDYFQVENPLPNPLFYYDVQKLYGLFFQNREKVSLDSAVEGFGLLEERPFHRALGDAYYTGRVLASMVQKLPWETFAPYVSIDYHRLPQTKKEEIQIIFPDYSKYVSRAFLTKEEAIIDRGVSEMRCYICGKALRKKIRWFSQNQKIYYALAICPQHGYLKGKIRMKHLSDHEVFAIKTLKLTDEEGAEAIRARRDEMHKRRLEKNDSNKERK